MFLQPTWLMRILYSSLAGLRTILQAVFECLKNSNAEYFACSCYLCYQIVKWPWCACAHSSHPNLWPNGSQGSLFIDGCVASLSVLIVIYNAQCPHSHLSLISSRWTQCDCLGCRKKDAFSKAPLIGKQHTTDRSAVSTIISTRWEPLTKWRVSSSEHKYFPSL